MRTSPSSGQKLPGSGESETDMNAWMRIALVAPILACSTAALVCEEPSREPAKARKEPAIPIRFQGLLPGNVNPQLEGQFRLELRIYPSPQGGQPIWRETLEVRAVKGQIDIELGTKTPIPMEIHEATYKWLGVSVNGQREVFPRYPIVNVVYASPREALLAHERWQAEKRGSEQKPGAGYTAKESNEKSAAVSPARKEQLTWREALESSRAAGGDLPDYEAWYRKLESLAPDKSADWTGHYEWVLPWVYDTASHGKYNNLFRGRFQGCDYSDLSPQKKYHFRLADRPQGAQPAAGPENGAGTAKKESKG